MPIAEAAALATLGWVASPIVKDLVDKSTSYLGSDIAKGLEDLETTLVPQFQLTIQAAQNSPNKSQLSGWLGRLKNAYYDAEGILHELEYERLKHKVKRHDKKLLVRVSSKPIIKPLVKFISHVHLSSKPIIKPLVKPLAKFADRAVKKTSLLSAQKRKLLKRLNKLKEIAAEAKNFRDLLDIQNNGIIQNAGNNNFVTTSLLGNADQVFGRDGDRDDIINFLLNEQGVSNLTKRYSVVAVTGMGGAGKTTLAQYVYNDPRVKNYFDVKIWLCLTQKFDIIETTKDIIELASGKRPNLSNLNNLQEEIVKTLPENKKVMVVLDDIWYDNDDGAAEKKQWENLLKPFDVRGGICKIVVTSRTSRPFPIELQPEKHIQLRDLAPDVFKSLLRFRAIDGLQFSNPQLKNDLSNIVDQISEKMSRLPLAAKVVGNQLRERPEIPFWQDTLEKVNLSNIMEILVWSFHHFNVQLQRCFLFCGVFPKGYMYDDLVPYWVALDFIQLSDDNRNVNDIGLEYFEKMIANSIIHPVSTPHKWYTMHDLFHDLAEKLSVEDCFRVTNVVRQIPSTVQHVYIDVLYNENLNESLSSICNLSNLRTIILRNPSIDDNSEIISKISSNFRNLRVLNVNPWGYKTMPRVVGDFRNLRYISSWKSSIEELPDSISKLYHLQFLELPSSVKTLPTKFSNLIKLQSIKMCNSDGGLVYSLPPVPYLGKLTSLQHLNEFHVRKEKGYELQQLGCLREIGGSLRIVNLENVNDKDEAIQVRLKDKTKLKRLELVWVESAEINGLEEEVIEVLRPPANLEGLTIDGYRGSRYPTWLQESSFIKHLKDVRFYNCNALTNLPESFHQFHYCSELILKNIGVLRELTTFPKNLTGLSIINCPSLIFICENEHHENENQSIMEIIFLFYFIRCYKNILDHELKSFEKTCSTENCEEQLRILKNAAQSNALELSEDVNKAWWYCHQERMKFIFRCNTRANELKLPAMLTYLHLSYCCVSDRALSNCLRGMATIEELHLLSIMTITTLPPAQVFKSLQSLRVLKIEHCWYLGSLGGLHALPNLKQILIKCCWCLKVESGYTLLPPTLQTFTIICCIVPQTVLNGNLSVLQNVEISTCIVPESLSFSQLTKLKLLKIIYCCRLINILGLESCPILENLLLKDCPKILELPELPASVKHIAISDCPVLTERCQPNGPDWHKIQGIQRREIQ